MTTQTTDIIVAGTGPAGLLAAIKLAESGFRVVLAGPRPNGRDRRTVALMRPALDLLPPTAMDAVRQEGSKLRTMRLIDATDRLFRSPPVTFHASEIDEPFFGINVPTATLGQALAQAARQHPGITWHECLVEAWDVRGAKTDLGEVRAKLATGTILAARLCVAADGRESPAREAAGIALTKRSLPQSALVVNFGHTRDHDDISTEFHTRHGPCTQVPLPGRRSSLVWVTRHHTAAQYLKLDETALSRAIEMQLSSFLGRVTVEPGRQVFPLHMQTPARFAQHRIALVGEAAHVFPPIGAQGLNLGFRDVADLTMTAMAYRDDPGCVSAMERYNASRRPDIGARSHAVALLNASLLSHLPLQQIVRGAGLGFLAGFAPLRAFFMREGMRPGSGFSALWRNEAEAPSTDLRSGGLL